MLWGACHDPKLNSISLVSRACFGCSLVSRASFLSSMRSFLSLASHDMFKLSHDKLYFLGIQGVLYHQIILREGPMSLFVGILT